MIEQNKKISLEHMLKVFGNKRKIYLPVDTMEDILSFSEIIFQQNTMISDFIRILKINNLFVVQEKTDKNEIALHLVEDELYAKEFVAERLETYEKMWDGCGCKVKYYDQ